MKKAITIIYILFISNFYASAQSESLPMEPKLNYLDTLTKLTKLLVESPEPSNLEDFQKMRNLFFIHSDLLKGYFDTTRVFLDWVIKNRNIATIEIYDKRDKIRQERNEIFRLSTGLYLLVVSRFLWRDE